LLVIQFIVYTMKWKKLEIIHRLLSASNVNIVITMWNCFVRLQQHHTSSGSKSYGLQQMCWYSLLCKQLSL
jgi:hypothetical protein